MLPCMTESSGRSIDRMVLRIVSYYSGNVEVVSLTEEAGGISHGRKKTISGTVAGPSGT
jgi:hypothetical protein